MTIDNTILIGMISFLFGVLGYFIRFQFERIIEEIANLSNQRTECRESLNERFSDRQEVKETFYRAFQKIDEHEVRLTVIEQSSGIRYERKKAPKDLLIKQVDDE